MRKLQSTFALIIAAICLGALFSGCASTRSENGITIKEQRSYNPLNFLPW